MYINALIRTYMCIHVHTCTNMDMSVHTRTYRYTKWAVFAPNKRGLLTAVQSSVDLPPSAPLHSGAASAGGGRSPRLPS